MNGETDLGILLAQLDPDLSAIEVVFCSVPHDAVPGGIGSALIGTFRDSDGQTWIVARSAAEALGLPFDIVLRGITLNVRSSLAAVGLTAAVAGRLARHGISANVVAACCHDHVFVPAADADRALGVLQALQIEAAARRDAMAAAPSGSAGKPLGGGCLCGVVRYQADALDSPIEHCHCATYRKAHAAAYASNARVLRTQFRWTQGTARLAAYQSSPGKLRRFCTVCGTHLVAERPAQPHVILRVATLDDDPGLQPDRHIWTSHDVPWLADSTEVPRYPDWPPNR